MGKRQPNTPKSKIKAALRVLWLRSRERAAAIKREKYCCEKCGAKQSKAKGKEIFLEVHHKSGIDWEELIGLIYQRLLPDPKHLAVWCKDCHTDYHGNAKKEKSGNNKITGES